MDKPNRGASELVALKPNVVGSVLPLTLLHLRKPLGGKVFPPAPSRVEAPVLVQNCYLLVGVLGDVVGVLVKVEGLIPQLRLVNLALNRASPVDEVTGDVLTNAPTGVSRNPLES